MRAVPALLVVVFGFVLIAATAWGEEIALKAECSPPEGWMKDGWGKVVFKLTNTTEMPAKVVGWSANWEAKGEAVDFGEEKSEDAAATDKDVVDLPPGKEVVVEKVGWLPPKAVDAAKPDAPVWTGAFAVEMGDKTIELPWRCAVPEAVLPEPLVTMKGDYIGFALMESRYEGFTSKDRLLTWLNDSYKAMWDLTGHRPYNGDTVIIQESPAHPWYAYAGNPIVMSTACMEGFVKEINDGIMPFGWIHELGHDFDDGIGEWYMWDGASCEWQANWKLNYAYETIPDQTFKAKWGGSENAGFQPPAKDMLVGGRQLMDSFFLFFGDPYLADASRTWDTMASDDLHAFFLRIERQYGWEPFKQMYRTYVRFEELGLDKPTTPDEKISLIAAILIYHTGVDLVPTFQRWRMPVTAESVAEMQKRYPIVNADTVKKPASVEAAAKLIKLTVTNDQKRGWMRDGWGQLRYTFKNSGTLPAKIVAWKAQWMIGDTAYDPAAEDDDGIARDEDVVYIPAGDETVVTKIGWLDPAMIDQTKPAKPLWKGTFTVRMGGHEFDVPWQIEVPEAVMKEKLVRVEGKHVAYEVTEKHYKEMGKNNERLLRWLNEAYEAMADLMGYTPYDGAIITIKESPDHPWYAYAGNPIIMDTTRMTDFTGLINNGKMPFGWIHELAHDFDIADGLYADWYALFGVEAQANIKVVYAYEAIPEQDWKAEWDFDKNACYPAPRKGILLSGKECMDRRFLFERDQILADPKIPWKEGFCQHVFLQRLACVYGWDPVKKWYRTYKILDEKGLEPPKTDEEMVQLMAAILCETTGVDLVPVFQRWRAPVTREDVEAMKQKYPIVEAVKSIVLPGKETAKVE